MRIKKLGKKARMKDFNSWFIDTNWAGIEFFVHRKYKTAILTHNGRNKLKNIGVRSSGGFKVIEHKSGNGYLLKWGGK